MVWVQQLEDRNRVVIALIPAFEMCARISTQVDCLAQATVARHR